MTEVPVVIIYTESQLSQRTSITIQHGTTVDDVRVKVRELATAYIRSQYPEARLESIHPAPTSVILATS